MTHPLWPDPATLPFKLFGQTGEAPSTAPAFSQGMDLVKKFWGNLPGGTALPGFLVPTVDVAELDKRLSDLRAAESWVEVNLNMLRATIQGLEVQRNTIATIQSLSAMAEGVMAGKAPAPTDAQASGLSAGWPMTPAAATAPQAATAEPPPVPPVASADPPADQTPTATTEVDPVVGLATSNWLGFMQQQFMKVAEAAIAPSEPDSVPQATTKGAATKRAGKTATSSARKKAKRRAPAAR